jgi:hypothetical protein
MLIFSSALMYCTELVLIVLIFTTELVLPAPLFLTELVLTMLRFPSVLICRTELVLVRYNVSAVNDIDQELSSGGGEGTDSGDAAALEVRTLNIFVTENPY